MNNSLPKIFIASSAENIDVLEAINENLDRDALTTTWKHLFAPSSNTLEQLIQSTREVDFAAFVFSPEDIAQIRGESYSIPRDNVLFELGLFMGALGKDRCFIITPRGKELKLPSDLLGITPIDYNSEREDKDLAQALTAPTTKIKRVLKKLGKLETKSLSAPQKLNLSAELNKLSTEEMSLLEVLANTYNSSEEGSTSWEIKKELNNSPEIHVDYNLILLTKKQLIERNINANFNGESYITFSITKFGLDIYIATGPHERNTTCSPEAPPFPVMGMDDVPF